MPSDEMARSVSGILKLLGDPSRLKIFWLLCHCEECVINIAALTEMSSPAVSHHLRLLKSSGLIVSRREGKEMYYKAADTEMTKSLHVTIESVADITCPG
ncbi:metalloregulator ArsR/SmtB family transcription factor [Lachnospiraceae bacterium NSJ-143]|nr:metalloregulator ArsR/SmtB family transcription factor [Lachnospiraceae bacterium NSJ-143]